MAEEVQISNVGGDGVASEVTLLALVAAIEKMSGAKGKGAAAKVQALHNQSVAAGTNATKQSTTATKKSTTATTTATAATNKYAKSIAGATGIVVGKLYGSFIGLRDALFAGKEDITSFATQLPFIGSHLGILTGIIDENIENFRSLSQVGATFGDGLNDIRASAARAGLPLNEFTELVSQNAQRMKFFGGTTAAGALAFASMSKELRTGPGRQFLSLGYTAQELNESLIDYAEFSQTQIGIDRRNSKMSADGAANYLETIDQLAAVTGKRRDQIKEEMNAAMADQRARLAMANMSAEEQAQFSANLAAAPAGLQDALKDAADGVLNNPLSQGLSVASETFRKDAANIKNMNAQEYNNFMAKVSQELDAAGQAAGAGAEAIMNSGTGYGEALALAAELRDKQMMSDQDYADLLENRAKEAANDKGLKEFSDAIRNIRTSLMDTLISSGVLKTLQDAFDSLASIIGTEEFKQGLNTGVTVLLDTVKMLGGAVASVVGFLSDIGENFGSAGVIAAVVAGIGGLFAAKAVVSALSNKAGSVVKDRVSALFGGGADSTSSRNSPKSRANAGKGAGNALGNIGKGLGKGLGGILKGIASGLIFAANPLVPLGAAAIGAAITAIGAGIAGATWLIGQSLPSLKDGLKGFEELNGDALISAGKGMGAVALGMGAFGAGSAVAGLGSLVGSVTSGIAGLFGGETDPLAQLEKFQEKSFDEATITANANSIVAYSKAMAALGAAEGLSGIGAAVGAVGGAIAGLFGAEDPLDKMKKFGEYEFNTAGIIANAGAVAAYAAAMKDFPTSPSASVFTALKDGVIGLLGGETDPFAPMMRFGNLKFNSEGIATNAGAVSAFADAMANMPTIDAERSGGVLGAIAGWFSGDEVMPWDSVKAFGDANISAEGVTANAAAINAMTSSLNGFSVEKLDTTGIVNYTSAMEKLVEVLGELNDELAADNKTGFGTGTNAGDVVSKMDTIGSGGGAGSDQLNNIMNQVLAVLNEMRDLDIDVEKNTRNIVGSNLAQGRVSNVAR